MKNKEKLIKSFYKINDKGWIKSVNNKDNGIGLTFEKELNKKPDSKCIADYEGIEIKCKSRFSNFPIALFSQSLESETEFETNRILQKYGKVDKEYSNIKVLYLNLEFNELVYFNNHYFKLECDDENEKFLISIYDRYLNFIEKTSYISFNSIKDKIDNKIKDLALVRASKKMINNDIYYRYYKLNLYKIKSFDKFIEAIKSGIISLRFECGILRTGDFKGIQKNKSIIFKIKQENMDYIYNSCGCYGDGSS